MDTFHTVLHNDAKKVNESGTRDNISDALKQGNIFVTSVLDTCVEYLPLSAIYHANFQEDN